MALSAASAAGTGRLLAAEAVPAGTVRVTRQGGAPVLYDLAQAVDAGSFQGQGFEQRCYRLPHAPALPGLSIFYRPDADGRRHELVFELSDAAMRQAVELDGYAVTLEIGGKTLLSGATPRHYWAARWRLQTAPRPPIRSVEALVKAGLVPAYQPGPRTVARGKPYEPMGLAGVLGYTPTTGERDDLGLFPAWVTAFLGSGDAAARQTMMANADAAATFPWHWRDETGQIFNIDRHPDWSIDPRFASPDKVASWPTQRSPAAPTVDDAHQPQLTYVAYLITGDPYYLEELQFQANWQMWSGGTERGLGLLYRSQVRGFAWTLRQVALAAAVTPDVVPAWLLPREYFLRKLENNRKWFAERTIESIDPLAQAYHFPWILDPASIASWQEDFVALVLGQIVRMGFTAWQPIYDWTCVNLVARGSGASGWPRAAAVWYYINLLGPDGMPITDWAMAAQQNAKVLQVPPDGGLSRLDINSVGTYLAAMKLAASVGHKEMLPIVAWYENRAPGRIAQKYLIRPDPAPAVPPQPAVPGDPQFKSGIQRLPPQAGRYPLADGAAQVIGAGSGQSLAVASDNGFWRVLRYRDGTVAFNNVHAGGQILVKGVDSVVFDGDSFDVAAGRWRSGRAL